MSEHLDQGSNEPSEPPAVARKKWQTPLVIYATIGGATAGGIDPAELETDPPFNGVS